MSQQPKRYCKILAGKDLIKRRLKKRSKKIQLIIGLLLALPMLLFPLSLPFGVVEFLDNASRQSIFLLALIVGVSAITGLSMAAGIVGASQRDLIDPDTKEILETDLTDADMPMINKLAQEAKDKGEPMVRYIKKKPPFWQIMPEGVFLYQNL
jgi:hypothetical protein